MADQEAGKRAKFEKAKDVIAAIFVQDGFFHKGANGQRGKRGDQLAGTIAGAMFGIARPQRTRRERQDAPGLSQVITEELECTLNQARKGDYIADRAIRLAFMRCVNHGFNVPKALLEYIAEVTVNDPKFSLPSRQEEGNVRDSLIVWAVSRAVDQTGISATRNDASPPYSACDAIEAVLKSIDRDAAIRFRQAQKIWNDRDKLEFRPSVLWQN